MIQNYKELKTLMKTMTHYLITTLFAIMIISCSKETKSEDKVQPATIKSIPTGDYSIANNESKLDWVGKEITTKIHTGTLDILDGAIKVNDDGLVKGNITIDMRSIVVTDLKGRSKEVLEGHLKSDDFFGSEIYPKAELKFESSSKILPGDKINFNGDLIIKDITNPIEFSAKVLETKPSLKAVANMTFDRSKYNVRFRSGTFFDDLGDKLILDNIDVEVNLSAKKG